MNLVLTGMFTVVPLFIFGVFVLLVGSILVGLVRNFIQWQGNGEFPDLIARLPEQSALVRVATKRQHVSGGDGSASTRYFATFETLADSLRQEFAIHATEYSALAEGDTGQLSYQGTRFKAFVRDRTPRPAPAAPVTAHAPAPDWTCAYCNSRVAAAEAKCPACGSSSRLDQARST